MSDEKEPSPPCQDCDLPDHECECLKPRASDTENFTVTNITATIDAKKVFDEIFGEKKIKQLT
jgi:hypothetical protein